MVGDRLLLKGFLLSILFHISIVAAGVLIYKYPSFRKNWSLKLELVPLEKGEVKNRSKGKMALWAQCPHKSGALFLYVYAGGIRKGEKLLTLEVKDRKIRQAMFLLKKKWIFYGKKSLLIRMEG